MGSDSVTYTVDNTAPVVTITAPTDFAVISLQTNPTIIFSAMDGSSGIAVINATLNGALITSGYVITQVGVYNLVVSATDGSEIHQWWNVIS